MNTLTPKQHAALYREWARTAGTERIVAAVLSIAMDGDECAVSDAGSAFASVLGWTEAFDAVALAPEQVRQVLAQASGRRDPNSSTSPT